jgi:hypothetical protein
LTIDRVKDDRLAALILRQSDVFVQDTSSTTLALTGVLGLAAVLYALYHLRGGGGEHADAELLDSASGISPSLHHALLPPPSCCRCRSGVGGPKSGCVPASLVPAERKPDDHDPQQGQQQQQQPADDPSKPSTSGAAGACSPPPAPASAAAAAVARRLAGVRIVTMSVLGVLLEERDPGQLGEAASVLPGAVGGRRLLPVLLRPRGSQGGLWMPAPPLLGIQAAMPSGGALLPMHGGMRPALTVRAPQLPPTPFPARRAGARGGAPVPPPPRLRPLPDVPGGGRCGGGGGARGAGARGHAGPRAGTDTAAQVRLLGGEGGGGC